MVVDDADSTSVCTEDSPDEDNRLIIILSRFEYSETTGRDDESEPVPVGEELFARRSITFSWRLLYFEKLTF
jgi:hypothetical protein